MNWRRGLFRLVALLWGILVAGHNYDIVDTWSDLIRITTMAVIPIAMMCNFDMATNWRRALFRIGIIASLLWGMLAAASTYDNWLPDIPAWVKFIVAAVGATMWIVAMLGLGVIMMATILGIAWGIAWVTAGFRGSN